jgi:hypothetical protein
MVRDMAVSVVGVMSCSGRLGEVVVAVELTSSATLRLMLSCWAGPEQYGTALWGSRILSWWLQNTGRFKNIWGRV